MRRCSWAAAATSTTCRWLPAPDTPPSCARPIAHARLAERRHGGRGGAAGHPCRGHGQRCARLVHALHRQRATAHGALVHRHRPGALRRRAGRHRRGRRPLPGGGRARAYRRALRTAGGHCRSRGCARRGCAGAARGRWQQPRQRAARSATASRRRRSKRSGAHSRDHGALPAQLLHAHRVPGPDRRL